MVYDSDPASEYEETISKARGLLKAIEIAESQLYALAPTAAAFMTYDRTLIVIRERSFLDLLDLALVVVRDRPIVLLA